MTDFIHMTLPSFNLQTSLSW